VNRKKKTNKNQGTHCPHRQKVLLLVANKKNNRKGGNAEKKNHESASLPGTEGKKRKKERPQGKNQEKGINRIRPSDKKDLERKGGLRTRGCTERRFGRDPEEEGREDT